MSPPSLHTGQGVIRRLWGVFWELLTINFGARAPLKAPESVVPRLAETRMPTNVFWCAANHSHGVQSKRVHRTCASGREPLQSCAISTPPKKPRLAETPACPRSHEVASLLVRRVVPSSTRPLPAFHATLDFVRDAPLPVRGQHAPLRFDTHRPLRRAGMVVQQQSVAVAPGLRTTGATVPPGGDHVSVNDS